MIGHTGSGKSTLIQHLNALIQPTSGTVSYNGEDVWAENYNRRALRSEVGLVFQYPEHQLFEMCIRDRYKGVEVPKSETEVTDEDVEAELKKEQEKNSRTVTVEDRGAENGDITTIDFEGFVDRCV